MSDIERIRKVDIEHEMKESYINYSMSVIVSRALPDVRDGMKPVHRRVLFGMNELKVFSDKPYKKSARIVGDVMGKYHPHGDSSIYMALVRMAQDWSLRYPLVDGQGNFGTMDGDSPAAMRYTEARMTKMSEEVLSDIEKDTVDMVKNFDETLEEPSVLPTRIPTLLVNGSQGIAVGMATNMAPHNLTEVVNGTIAYIDNNDITTDELMQYITAPDFPTGGYIYGYKGVKDAYETGRGRVTMRARTHFETNEHNNHEMIVVTEVPYMVNKAEMVKKIADLSNNKVVEGISDINDESDRNGTRVVIEVKKDANPEVVLNTLFHHSDLQSNFSINNVALVNGRPETLPLKEIIRHFVDHRHEIVIRRTKFDLAKAEQRAHIVEGLIIAVDNIDEVIQIIRSSKEVEQARLRLIERFELSHEQASAIVEMRLRQLTGLAIEDLRNEFNELQARIADYKDILARVERRMEIIKEELLEIREKYGDKRRSEIIYATADMNPEDFYANEEVVITISHLGYIKRTNLSEFKAQRRGGSGHKGSGTRNEDFIEKIYHASMHNYMLFFTQQGQCHWMRVFELPEGNKLSKGRAIQNLLNLAENDKVTAFVKVDNLKDSEFAQSHYLIFCTQRGIVKRISLDNFTRPRVGGILALLINEGDKVIAVNLTDGNQEVIIANSVGKAVRFEEKDVRPMHRLSAGMRGMTLDMEKDADNQVVGMLTVPKLTDRTVLIVTENGYGKRSWLDDRDDDGNIIFTENGEPSHNFRLVARGGKGVRAILSTAKTGKVVGVVDANNDDDLMIINKSGVIIRIEIKKLKISGRKTQGVRLINLDKTNDEIASVCRVTSEAAEDAEIESTEIDNTPIAESENPIDNNNEE